MKYILLFCIVFSSHFVFSQEEKSAFDVDKLSLEALTGIQLSIQPGDYDPSNYLLGVFARYNFYSPKDWISVSLSTPAQFGLNMVSTSSGTLTQFSTDIPLTIDLNLGARAINENENLIGGFVGGGLGYNFTYFTVGATKINSHSSGPIVHAGFRLNLNGRPVGIRAAYMWGLINNFEKDEFLIYEEYSFPTTLTLNLFYSIR